MKHILVAMMSLIALSGHVAFANSVDRSFSCNLGKEAVALVTLDADHSGQGFVSVVLFTEDSGGKFQPYYAAGGPAVDSFDFPKDYGGNYSVKFSRFWNSCSIEKKASQ
jgi:hypothetical protein